MRSHVQAFALSLALWSGVAMSAQVPAAISADPPVDKANPARMKSFQIPSHGAQMNAFAYIAAGAGSHPVVILLHGFPGNEKNLDLAQAMRRAGWDVLYFNYRGSWGSPGDFSFIHAMEDTLAAIAYVRTPAVAADLHADPSKIVLMGHSMGGLMAAWSATQDTHIRAIALISGADMGGRLVPAIDAGARPVQMLKPVAGSLANEGMAPLAGCTPESLATELIDHATAWSFAALAPKLATTPALIVTSDDGGAAPAKAMAATMTQAGNKAVTQVHIATDHSYSDRRIELETTVLNWLATLK